MFPSESYVKQIKEKYTEGTRIVLDRMGDDPNPIAPGTKGTVKHVDDIGTVNTIIKRIEIGHVSRKSKIKNIVKIYWKLE